jgi:small subunit ribosomal protein S8
VLKNQVGNMAKIKFTNDIIADSLTRLRNSVNAKKNTAELPNVKMVMEILKVLSNNHLIESYTIDENENLLVTLKVDGRYKFSILKRVSKPGVRIYKGANEIKPVKGGKGVLILSTSKGVMSGWDAKKQGIGGEVLCEIW